MKTASYIEKFERAEVGTYDRIVCVEETGHFFAVGLSYGVPFARPAVSKRVEEKKPDSRLLRYRRWLFFVGKEIVEC